MKICHMCGGEYKDSESICPICGTKEKTKLGLKLSEEITTDTNNSDNKDLLNSNSSNEEMNRNIEDEREISYAIEDPYLTDIKSKMTEKEYYNSVDNRKYKHKIQLGYIMIYALIIISLFSSLTFMDSTSNLMTFGTDMDPEIYKKAMMISIIVSAFEIIIPTLFIQFCRSRIAAVILVILCLINLLGNFSGNGTLLLLGAIYCTIGVFDYKSQWKFYNEH
ncbi:MAG: hypothetical protein ACI4F4_10935 [Lachnospiraceae bacterium]